MDYADGFFSLLDLVFGTDIVKDKSEVLSMFGVPNDT